MNGLDTEQRNPQKQAEKPVSFDDLVFYVVSLLAQVEMLGINFMQPLEEADQERILRVFKTSDLGLLAELNRVIALGLTPNIENAFNNRYGAVISFSVGVLLRIYQDAITPNEPR